MVNDYSFPPLIRQALALGPPGQWAPSPSKDCIRLDVGYPYPEAIPVYQLSQSVSVLCLTEGDRPFQYLGSSAMANLKPLLQSRSAIRGISTTTSEVLATAGSTQALDLAARVLLHKNDLVAVESPTYMEALEIFRNYTPHLIEYPIDHEGLDVKVLADDLEMRHARGLPLPKVLYSIPTFHNPTGVSLGLQRRKDLLSLAELYNFLIIEDDAYGQLSGPDLPPPIKALDTKKRVIYLGSMSKVVAPGLRIGWTAAPKPIITAMAHFKKDADHPFTSAVTTRFLTEFDFDSHIKQLRHSYSQRLKTMLRALKKHMPEKAKWSKPLGGFFVWVHLPYVNTSKLLPIALDQGVSYIPGSYFFTDPTQGLPYLRLSFSYAEEERIEQGIATLANLI